MSYEVHNNCAVIEDRYNKEEEIFTGSEGIYEKGFSVYVKNLSELKEAFKLQKKCVCCIDEGTSEGMHVAGSLILLNEEQLKKYLAEANPDELTSHAGCGAAMLCAKKDSHNDFSQAEADEYAQKLINDIANKYHLKYTHIPADKMNRPPEGHFARVCYYDFTGKFNYFGVTGMPAGFTISRKFLELEYALTEAGVALNIAFGDHGLGEGLLTEDKPFLLVAIVENEEQLKQAQQELNSLKSSHSKGAKIKVDFFMAPEIKQEN